MDAQQFKLVTSDGLNTIGNVWKTDKELKGNVVISHGMCEYSLRYDDFAKFLNEHGYDVYALDQVGHGLNQRSGLGVWNDYSFKQCVKNLHTEMEALRATSKPTILIGHSMGSFVCQYYLQKYSRELHINGVILSGTSGPSFKYKFAYGFTLFHSKFHKLSKPSKFLNNLAFSSFNKKIKKKDRHFKMDWLTTDKNVVENYMRDRQCNFTPSIGFFLSFFKALNIIYKNERLDWIQKDLPILITGGDMDPVGEYAKGLHKLQATYAEHGLSPEVKVYKGMRHEILNEIGKQEVYDDFLKFIEEHTKSSD